MVDVHEQEGIRRLFQAVVGQAAQHALGRPYGGEWPSEGEVWAARRWFRGDPPGVELACHLARVPLGLVQRTIEEKVAAIAYPTAGGKK